MAALIAEMTGHERVAFCNTGSEAVLAAMRLARTVTGRSKIVTFAGAYHGIFDEVLARGVSAGRRAPIAAHRARASRSMRRRTWSSSTTATRSRCDTSPTTRPELAAVLVEPVQSRHPDLQPVEFLRELRRATPASGVALIFDEMITGFRVAPGGAQALFGIQADLATYGKVIGGGFPIGVVAGNARFMDALDGGAWQYGDDSIPEADVTWFAGTFVRHPLALAAARAVLQHLREAGPEPPSGAQRSHDGASPAGSTISCTSSACRSGSSTSARCSSTRFERDQQFSSLFYFHLRDQGIHITEGRARLPLDRPLRRGPRAPGRRLPGCGCPP